MPSSRFRSLVLASAVSAIVAGAAGSARGQSASIEPPSASVTIDRLDAGLLDLMKRAKELGYAGRRDLALPLVSETYDLEFMARTIAGRHWRSFDESQRKKLLDTFTRMTVANYAGRFTGYDGDRFENRGEEPAGLGTVLVRTALVSGNGETTRLDYRLRREDGGSWRIIDVFLNGTVSELALRRSEYGDVIERQGFDALIAALESKVTAFEKGEGAR